MKDDVKNISENASEAKEFFKKLLMADRRVNVDSDSVIDELVREGKAKKVKLPEDPEEAKRLLTEIVKNYPLRENND